MNNSSNILHLKNITSGYGEAMVVHNVNFEVKKGEIVSLLGKNGMGKSTLLKTIMGYLRVRGGEIELNGDKVTGEAPHKIAKRSVAYSPQEQAIFQDLTIRENLLLGSPNKKWFEKEFERICELFPVLGQRLKQRAGTLSGGEQKMLLVSRALMARPKLILIDEITEGLQPSVIQRLAQALLQERERTGVSMLLVEQHIQFALEVSDRWAVLKLGEIDDQGISSAQDAGVQIAKHFTV